MSARLDALLNEVAVIRENHPRTGELLRPIGTGTPAQVMAADMTKGLSALTSFGGETSWAQMLSTLSTRTCASTGPDLRSNLLELAALCVAFVENIDRVKEIEADNA